MGGGLPGARGVITANQALHRSRRGQPAPLHNESLPMAHLARQTAKAPIRQQPKAVEIRGGERQLKGRTSGSGQSALMVAASPSQRPSSSSAAVAGRSKALVPARNSRINTR
jgi:hypothetical protein